MEQDRDINQVLMNIRGATGGIISTSLISARITFQLAVFLMRLAKKGMVAAGLADSFKDFIKTTEGKYVVYNIPLKAGRAEKLQQINELELKLQNARNPMEKAGLRNEIKRFQREMPELEQLKKLGIEHCILPKLNGADQTIQVAVSKKSDQTFKNWFLNHLTSELSGGEKGMEEIRIFTEGNYTIFNLPFEEEEFKAAIPDFEILGINYAVLPDLKVGDGNSQIAIPNADRGKLESWFTMWRDRQLREGKEAREMYAMDQESYMSTSCMKDGDYVVAAEEKYQEVNAEFEAQSKKVPWSAPMQKENSEEYVRYLQDKNYEKVTINKETLVENMNVSAKTDEMRRNGYFISRIPGTYEESQKTLIIPIDQVFSADDGKTYLAFLPKNQKVMVADSTGNITQYDFHNVYQDYAKVQRSMNKVESLKKGASLKKDAALKKAAAAKAAVPKIPKL